MERILEIRTGESVGIRYELAGLGSRFLAVGLDVAIQLAATVSIVVALSVVTAAVHPPSSIATSTAVKTGRAIVGAIGIFAAFILYFGYFVIFELWWSGRTPGKRVLGIRVVRDAGFPIDVGAAVIRNVIRVLEFGLGFYFVSAIATLISAQNKRLGDMAAGTIVVRDRRYEASAIAAYLAKDVPADDGLSATERELIERYVARRGTLEPLSRSRLAAIIARRVRPQLRATFDHLSDEELLEHLGRGGVPL